MTQYVIAFPWAEHVAASWSAVAALATAGVAAAAALFAARQVRESKRLRQEQAEPYVAASLEYDVVTGSVDVVVKNYGSTAAYDIQLEAVPPLERTDPGAGIAKVKLPESIRTLVPGQEWRTLLDFSSERVETELPNHYDVTVRYKSYGERRLFRPSERKVLSHSYTYGLDIAAIQSTAFVKRYTIHNVARALLEVSKTLKAWGESPTGKGVAVYSRDGDAKDERRRAEIAEIRAERATWKAKQAAKEEDA